MSSRPTPDREGFPARIPEYVFTTAAIVTANPDVKARLPWFRRAVESAFMNGYEHGRKAAARDIRAVRDTCAADACCKGTGECGIDDCRVDSARDDAFTDAADIAEKGATR